MPGMTRSTIRPSGRVSSSSKNASGVVQATTRTPAGATIARMVRATSASSSSNSSVRTCHVPRLTPGTADLRYPRVDLS